MSAIGHWFVTIGGDGEPRRVYTDRVTADRDAHKLALSVMEIMPVAQHRGAVEALREMADAVRGTGGDEQDRALVLMRALTKADAILGGQSQISAQTDQGSEA